MQKPNAALDSGRNQAKERLAGPAVVRFTVGTKFIGSGWSGRGLLFAFAAGGVLRAADAGPAAGLFSPDSILHHPLFLTLLAGCIVVSGMLMAARRRLAEANRTLERKIAERTASLEADIRRREVLEKALVESEERFAKAFNHAPMLATISSMSTGRIMAANQRFCECLGYSREELLGNRTAEMGIWLNPLQREEFIRQVREGADVNQREVPSRARDGRILTILVSFERVGLGAEDCLLTFGVDITERRAVERRLQASEDMFSRAFRHNPLLAAITSLVDQRMIDCNERLCEFVGQDRERLLNSVPGETGVWVETKVRNRLIQRVLHEQIIHNEEIELRNGRGETRRLLVSLQRLTLNGEPVALWLSSDITEKSRLADAVRTSERRFHELFEQSGDAITVADATGRFVDGNPAALALLRCTPAELRRIRLEDLAVPEERDRLAGHLQRVAIGEKLEGEFRLLRCDRAEFVAEITVRRTAEGGSFAFVRDITERREAMDRLRESEALLNETGTIAKVGGWRLDLATGEMQWTDEAARIHGVPAGFAVPVEPMISRYAPESAERIRHGIRRAAESGESFAVETTMGLPGGELRWIRILGRAGRQDGRITHLRGTVQDISDCRLLEAQLLQAQKMEAIGQLSGGIAHDFNNILGAIVGNAQLAKLELAADHPAAEYLEQIVTGSRRATKLVRQILTFARQNPQEMARVDLGPVIEESVRLLKATIPSTISIRLSVQECLPPVIADETQIQQVILNLGTNAWHAMEGRIGRLDLSAETAEVGADLASRHPGIEPGRHLRLRVSDNGHGMPAEVVRRIFDPFFTTKESGKGSGLGLSVVHGIVKSHGGLIGVESTPDVGTTFDIYLPVAELVSTPQPAEPVNGASNATAAAGRHILVVDDEIPLLRVTTRVLERLGYRVTACPDAVSALEVFPRIAADLALVITDMNIPGPSGLELTRAVRAQRTDLPVLLTSGFITEGLRSEASEAGVAGILRKPLGVEDLDRAIRNHLLS